MSVKIPALILLLVISPLSTAKEFCTDDNPHAIDGWFNDAMSKTGGVTVNIRKVQSEAYERWDNELNRVYSDLIEVLIIRDKEALKGAQRSWITYRDAEFQLLRTQSLYGGLGGSISPVAISDEARNIVRARACTLLKYHHLASR